MFALTGKTALVTGADRGIGAATAVAFAEAGADVVLTARSADQIDSVAAAVRARGRRALAVPGDVNDLAFLATLVDAGVGELGGLDVVVNNAGGWVAKPAMESSAETIAAAMHFNVIVAYELIRLAVPHLLARGGGAVVNVSSVAGVHHNRGSFEHALSKATLNALTQLLANELSPRIRVNAVLPGAVETEALRWFLDRQPPEVRDHMRAVTPMRRNGDPDDIAAAILYLASPASGWVTGKLLEVDGNAPPGLIPSRQPDV
jgi:7-alpha-hydroxysteroid dehydrogenase